MSDEGGGGGVPALVSLLAEGFSAPLVGLCVLGGIIYGVARHELGKSSPELRPDAPIATQPADDGGFAATPDAPAGEPADAAPPRTAAEVRTALDRGEFARALSGARALGERALEDEARLFEAMTRGLAPGRLAAADVLIEAPATGGERLLGAVVSEEGGALRLELLDGQERELRGEQLASKRELRGAERASALRAAISAAERAAGADAGGLALHRLAYQAFGAGQRDLGTALLKRALIGAEGSILVDMFGEGDFARLHRARRVLAGEAPEPEPEPIAMRPPARQDPPARRDPPPPVARVPDDEDPADTPTPQPPRPKPARGSDVRVVEHGDVSGDDPILADADWQAADAAYRSGLDLYRGTFGASARTTSIAVRAALKEFRRAQDGLNKVAARSGAENYYLERRQEELAKLVIDCMRRQKIDD